MTSYRLRSLRHLIIASILYSPFKTRSITGQVQLLLMFRKDVYHRWLLGFPTHQVLSLSAKFNRQVQRHVALVI